MDEYTKKKRQEFLELTNKTFPDRKTNSLYTDIIKFAEKDHNLDALIKMFVKPEFWAIYGVEGDSITKNKKDSKPVNVYLEKGIFDELNDVCNKTGLSKTVVIENALKDYFEKLKQEGIKI